MYRTWILFISEKKGGGIQIIKLMERNNKIESEMGHRLGGRK